jgi:nucleoside-diphosphate-sugar epimerase
MKVLVTGASGNIGSHTVPQLRAAGHQVRQLLRDTAVHRRDARTSTVDTVFGDIRDEAAVGRAVAGVDAVVHLAAVIPPGSVERPQEAERTNIAGTATVVSACTAQPVPPKLLFTSTFDVHGHTLAKPPPRHVEDPLVATDGYTAQKIEAERIVRESGLTWAIFRMADVPVLGARSPHPIMYAIGLANRIEALHADDAGLALTNAMTCAEVWGRILFIGGGPSCQLTYREYLTRMLAAMGIAPLPDEAFSTAEYATDWLDTEDSQRLLHYQRHTFDDITAAVARGVKVPRFLVAAAGPAARAVMLRMSPYYRRAR